MILSEQIRRVAELQPLWTSENTTSMQERGELIPETLRARLVELRSAIGSFGDELEIKGSDT